MVAPVFYNGSEKIMNSRTSKIIAVIGIALLALLVALLAILVFQNSQRGDQSDKVTFNTEYQAVLLSNGLAYFGKIEQMGAHYLVMTDVYYVQTGVNQEKKERINILVKRGKEWHAPDRIIINRNHILSIEPVSPDSTVAKRIEDLTKQSNGN